MHLINDHFFGCVQWHSRGNTPILSKATSWGLQSDLHPARWLPMTCTHWKPVLPSPSPSLRAATSCVRSSAPTQQPSSSHTPPSSSPSLAPSSDPSPSNLWWPPPEHPPLGALPPLGHALAWGASAVGLYMTLGHFLAAGQGAQPSPPSETGTPAPSPPTSTPTGTASSSKVAAGQGSRSIPVDDALNTTDYLNSFCLISHFMLVEDISHRLI